MMRRGVVDVTRRYVLSGVIADTNQVIDALNWLAAGKREEALCGVPFRIQAKSHACRCDGLAGGSFLCCRCWALPSLNGGGCCQRKSVALP